jgi:uncharacterized protein YlxW (UPF0749 family)
MIALLKSNKALRQEVAQLKAKLQATEKTLAHKQAMLTDMINTVNRLTLELHAYKIGENEVKG